MIAGLSVGVALSYSVTLADIGSNVRLNSDTVQHTHAETSCASSILNPNIMVVGCNDDSGSSWTLRKVHYFQTSDGGETWNSALIAHGGPDCSRAGDPSVCSDALGRFYAMYVCRPCGDYSRVYAHRSDDNGVTWTAPVAVHSVLDGLDLDKPWATCDMNSSSPYVNNVYVVWRGNRFDHQIQFKRSTDSGVTFTNYQVIGSGVAPCPAVGPDGTIYVIWISAGVVSLRRSSDGGDTWTAPQQITALSFSPCSQASSDPAITCDISNGSRRGWVYLCYLSGAQGGIGGVYVRHSTDQGATWSDPVRVSDIAEYSQWFPWLAVHPETGDLGMSWLDSRDGLLSCNFVCYASLSTDGGATWCPNVRLSDSLSNSAQFDYTMGDYTGVTFGNLGFLSAWPDRRSGSRYDVYAAWWNNGFELTMNSPAAGDTAYLGMVNTITWNFRYAPDTLSIELNRDYPSENWEHLADVRSRDRMWLWLVSGPHTDHARLRLIGVGCSTFADTMDGDFSIRLATPTHLSLYRAGNDIRLRWQSTGAPYYCIYSAPTPDGDFTSLEGSTSATVFLDIGAVAEPAKFYVVRASTEP